MIVDVPYRDLFWKFIVVIFNVCALPPVTLGLAALLPINIFRILLCSCGIPGFIFCFRVLMVFQLSCFNSLVKKVSVCFIYGINFLVIFYLYFLNFFMTNDVYMIRFRNL